MAESNGLLNRRTGNRTGGSNPPLSAIFILKKNENGERSRKASPMRDYLSSFICEKIVKKLIISER